MEYENSFYYIYTHINHWFCKSLMNKYNVLCDYTVMRGQSYFLLHNIWHDSECTFFHFILQKFLIGVSNWWMMHSAITNFWKYFLAKLIFYGVNNILKCVSNEEQMFWIQKFPRINQSNLQFLAQKFQDNK